MRKTAIGRRGPSCAAILALATLPALGLLGAASAAAQTAGAPGMALGSGGNFYTVRSGTYGSLFANTATEGVQSISAMTPVLALQVSAANTAPQMQLIPSTEDNAVESTPTLIFEDQTNTLYVVWVSTSDQVASTIKLAAYGGGQWSAPVAVMSNPYAAKSAPLLALTRDSHLEIDPGTGNPVTHHRTLLHVVWSEQSASGTHQTWYAPVIFADGAWIGSATAPVLLNGFDLAEPVSSGLSPTPLAAAPALQSGSDANTVVAGFASETSGMLTTVEIAAIPEDYRVLGDSVAAAVLASGGPSFPQQLGDIATQVWKTVVANGGALVPEIIPGIVGDAQNTVLTTGAPDLPTLAGRIRGVIIDSGRRVAAAHGVVPVPVAPPGAPVAPPQVLEIVSPDGPSQFLEIRVAATRPTPAVPPAATAVQLVLSHAGDNAVVSWPSANGGALSYLYTQPDGTWSSSYQLPLGQSLTLTQALQMVQARFY